MEDVLTSIQKYATLSAAEINAVWPGLAVDDDSEAMSSDTGVQDEQSSSSSTLSLRTRAIEEALKRLDEEDYTMKRDDAEALVWEYLLDHPQKLTKRS